MKKIISMILVIAIFMSFASVSSAAIRVSGYTKSNGTYVAPSYRTSPNATKIDNYSTKGNYNPYTGKVGTRRY
jgi:uncharacterized protein YpmB